MRSATKWERTQVQALLRDGSSGIYYGRWKLGGKQKWKSLKTSVFSVAKLRLVDEAAVGVLSGDRFLLAQVLGCR